jgi:hypothetical protein
MSAVPIAAPTTWDGDTKIPNHLRAGAVLLDQLPKRSESELMATVTELHPPTEIADTQPIQRVDPVPDGPDFDQAVPAPRNAAVFVTPPPVKPTVIRIAPVEVPEPAPVTERQPDPEPAAEIEQQETVGQIVGGFFYRAVRRVFGQKNHEQEAATQHTSWFVVGITALFALIATAAAFRISFETLLLTMQAMGLGEVAHYGPISIDIAALAAAVFLITPGRENRRLGWMFLTFSTGASIYGNLVGHAIQEARHVAPFQLPSFVIWEQSGLFFSVFFPLAMAILVHASIKQVSGNLEHRKRVKAEEEKAERQRAAEAKAAAERQARAEAAQAERDELIAALPKPKRGEVASKAVGVAYGVAHQVTTFAPLRDVLKDAGYKLPASETTVKNWLPEVKEKLGLV